MSRRLLLTGASDQAVSELRPLLGQRVISHSQGQLVRGRMSDVKGGIELNIVILGVEIWVCVPLCCMYIFPLYLT